MKTWPFRVVFLVAIFWMVVSGGVFFIFKRYELIPKIIELIIPLLILITIIIFGDYEQGKTIKEEQR